MTASADTPNDSPDHFRVSHASNRSKDGSSTNGVGSLFQSFKINDLEMVDQTGIEPGPGVGITRAKSPRVYGGPSSGLIGARAIPGEVRTGRWRGGGRER